MPQKWPKRFEEGPYKDVVNVCWAYGEAQSHIEGPHVCPQCKQDVVGVRKSERYVFLPPHERK